MPGLDKIQYSTLERLLSTDMNADARLRGRGLMEILRYDCCSTELNSDNDAVTGESTNPKVLGGLKVIPSVGGVTVTPGVLMQYWSGGGTQPGTDESQFVFGQQRENIDVAIAVPVSDTWYLIQARATTTQTNATRDIWDPGTETFGGTVIGTKLENTVELNAKVGTATDMPLPDAGWVQLGGVKRLSSGVDSTTKEMVDVRPLYDRKTINVQSGGVGFSNGWMVTSHFNYEGTTAGNTIAFNLQIQDDTGYMFARTRGEAFVDITQAAILDPSTVLAASTWYYLYLVVWNSSVPRQAYDNITTQGMLVLSHLGPTTQGSADMPDGVTYPAPFAQDTSRVGTCCLCLKRNAGNDGWEAQQLVGNRITRFRGFTPDVIGTGASFALGAGIVPKNAKRIALDVLINAGTGNHVLIKNGSQVIRSVPCWVVGQPSTVDIPTQKLTPANISFVPDVPADDYFIYLATLEL